MNDITAIIPVRAGSTRLKNKNILPFNGTNLLLHKINQLKNVKSISRIVVSSDSDIMLKIASDNGTIIQKRPLEYCDEKSKSWNDVVQYIVREVEGEHILWSFCTSPLMTPSVYEKSIETYLKSIQNGYDSLISVSILNKYIWNDFGPVNYDPNCENIIPKKKLPNYYIINDGIYIAQRKNMEKWRLYHGKKPFLFLTDKIHSVDIDDNLDYLQAISWLHLVY